MNSVLSDTKERWRLMFRLVLKLYLETGEESGSDEEIILGRRCGGTIRICANRFEFALFLPVRFALFVEAESLAGALDVFRGWV